MLGTKSSNYYLLNMSFVVLISHMAAKIITYSFQHKFFLANFEVINWPLWSYTIIKAALHTDAFFTTYLKKTSTDKKADWTFETFKLILYCLNFSKNLMKIKNLSKISLQIADWNEYDHNASKCTSECC